MKIMQQN